MKRYTTNIHKPGFILEKQVRNNDINNVYLKCNARNTCACEKHLNMQLKLNKLRELKIIESNNVSEIMSNMTCGGKGLENCMLGLCLECKEKKLNTLEYDNTLTFYYYKWGRIEEERINKSGEKYKF